MTDWDVMLGSVRLFTALARLFLILGVSGVLPQLSVHADNGAGDHRAIRPAVAVTLARALRPGDGMVLTTNDTRREAAGRSSQFAGETAVRVGVSPPGASGALIPASAASQRLTSRTSEPVRGPPQTI